LSAKLTKKRTPSDCFFSDFAYWGPINLFKTGILN